jgi:hypothetical protein
VLRRHRLKRAVLAALSHAGADPALIAAGAVAVGLELPDRAVPAPDLVIPKPDRPAG